MSSFSPRTTAPSTTDLNWITVGYGGYNKCINIANGSVLPNCTGYVHGRWIEISGYTQETGLSLGNASSYYGHTSDGYTRSSEPTLGACICFSGGAGHVGVVEEIASDSSYIVCSESNYGGSRFVMRTRYRSNNWKLAGSSVTFQGFIVNPWISDTPPEPQPSVEKNMFMILAAKKLISNRNGGIQ